MEDTTPLKIVTIDDNEYHIGRFTAQQGSWLLMRMMKALREFMKGIDENDADTNATEPDNFSEMMIQTLLTDLDYDDFEKIQRASLGVVSRTDYAGQNPFQQPVQLRNGKFSFRDLDSNIDVVMALTSQALFANLSPFFTKTGLKAVMAGQAVSFR